MEMLLKKKNAVIYGGAGAIGGAVARAFAREGAKVFLAGRTLARLEAVAAAIRAAGGEADAAPVDAGGDVLERPRDLVPKTMCALSGREATALCPRVRTEWLAAGGAPGPCRWHRHAGTRVVVAWPPEYRAWARAQGLLEATV